MTGRFAVLAVCTANICRSPMMEVMLRSKLDSDRFEVASAGVQGFCGQPMDAMSEMELMRHGLDARTFRSHPIDDYLVSSANVIVTATRAHRMRIVEDNPRAMRWTFTLLELAALCDEVTGDVGPSDLIARAAALRPGLHGPADVRDPYRRDPRVHRETADQIAAAVDIVAARLNRSLAASTG